MYIVDFFKNLFKKNNIGTVIWMILNVIIICLVFVFFSGATTASDVIISIFVGLLAYVTSVAIALSPVGETIMRWQNGCHKVEDSVILARIQPIFEDVYANAKKKNPELPEDIKLYMSEDKTPNAFAMGRHTVCFTKGLLSMSDSDIRGILGHEFGHLAHKDTDTILVMTIGNLIVSIIFALWRFFFNIIARITNIIMGIVSHSWGALIAGAITRIFIDFLLVADMTLWTKLGVIICMASSRANEYFADKYSFELGYGYDLCNALRRLDGSSHSKGLWAALSSSHPATIERLNKLNQLIRGEVY